MEVDVLNEETMKATAHMFRNKQLDLLVTVAELGLQLFDWYSHTAEILVEKFHVKHCGMNPLISAK